MPSELANVLSRVLNARLLIASYPRSPIDRSSRYRHSPFQYWSNPDQTEEQQLASATVLLPSALGSTLDALAASELAARIFGPQIIQTVLAVRRWELDHYGNSDADQLPEKFRFAWSI